MIKAHFSGLSRPLNDAINQPFDLVGTLGLRMYGLACPGILMPAISEDWAFPGQVQPTAPPPNHATSVPSTLLVKVG